MEELKRILRSFFELRNKYSDFETAIEAVCISTGLDRERVLEVLSMTGVFVFPGSEEEEEINRFISSADMTRITIDELARKVGFSFCISDKEAQRLVHKLFNYSKEGGFYETTR